MGELNLDVNELDIYDIVINESDEKAVNALLIKLEIQNLNVEGLLSVVERYGGNSNNPMRIKIKSFHRKNQDAIIAIYKRIFNFNFDKHRLLNHSYLNMKNYTEAHKRYEAIAKRVYDRLEEEWFYFERIYPLFEADGLFQNIENIMPQKSEQVYYKQIEQQPIQLDSLLLINVQDYLDHVRAYYKKLYQNMKLVRLRNAIYKTWCQNHKSTRNKVKRRFREESFCKLLDKPEFLRFFGENSKDRVCHYCKTSEQTLNKMHGDGLIYTKKDYVKGSSLEIDQKDPGSGYQLDNIVLSCYWCNNAKTDEFNYDEFLEVGKVINDIWRKRRS